MKDHLQALVRKCDPLQGRNVAREYLQARILEAMQRAGAMASLAFQGGTCLRFLFALPRYSEDLDFALEGEPSKYELRRYLQAIRGALSAESYRVELRVRDRHIVHRALVGFPGLLHELGLSPHASEALAIRIEVDTNPPAGAETAIALVRRHTTLRLHHHGQSSLLAGKLHAVLQRPYTKGRDLYDLIWYLSDRDWPPPNLSLLTAALMQSGWDGEELTPDSWRRAVGLRLEALDWSRAAADVAPFLERREDMELVTKENALGLLAQAGDASLASSPAEHSGKRKV